MSELFKDAITPAVVSPGSHIDEGGIVGHLNTLDVALAALAYAGPLAGTAGYTTLVVGLGNGLGTPSTFLAVTVVLLCFAIGYAAMTRFIPKPGAFYAYISAGLGRAMGLGSSFTLMISYVSIGVGFYGFAGIAAKQLVEGFGGPHLVWWIYSFLFWIAVSTVAYFHVALSAKILGVLLIAEVLAVLVFDVMVLGQGGAEGISFESFTLPAFLSGHLGIAMIFSVSMFCGFEATAIYREETRDPDKTIPRATIMVVLFIGLFYTITSWSLILALGPSGAVEIAAKDPANAFFRVATFFCGKLFYDVTSVLLLTSIFAAHLAIQNVTTRYAYSLAVDGVFPRWLGVAHSKHRSPHRASMSASAIYLILTAALTAVGLSAEQIYSWFAGLAAFIILCAMTVTSLAAIAYFARNRVPLSRWNTMVAPALAAVGLMIMVVLGIQNFPVLIGGSVELANFMLIASAAVFVMGVAYAYCLKRHEPDVFQRIGRN